ncbi:unnamed protein product, partial [Rotaria magnacalcarata]
MFILDIFIYKKNSKHTSIQKLSLFCSSSMATNNYNDSNQIIGHNYIAEYEQ